MLAKTISILSCHDVNGKENSFRFCEEVVTKWLPRNKLTPYLSALDFCNSPPPILIFQGYQLCVLDYDFMILNNAFLIHRPGIKTAKSSSSHIDKAKVAAQNDFIKKIIMPELKQLYGTRKGCEK